MEFYFTNEEVAFLSYCAENIQKIIGRAIGREENFKARRDTFRVLDFQTALKKTPPNGTRRSLLIMIAAFCILQKRR